MSIIFHKLEEHAFSFQNTLKQCLRVKNEQHPFPWENLVFESDYIRRAHLDIVDCRDTKKLFMMHLCVFPNTNNSAPIYGFDLIAGPNKVTGAFFDFSPVSDTEHLYSQWFSEEVSQYTWSKPRELPTWARNIFSKNMVAAGNINSKDELEEILSLSKKALSYYLSNIHLYNTNNSFLDKQNYYCQNQKLNPHTPRVMQSLGYSPELVSNFIETCLFPEV